MREVKSVKFWFENCDGFEIEKNVIGSFYLGDIQREIARRACNSINEMSICNTFFIEIFEEGNVKFKEFGDLDEMYKFDRLKTGDITSIEVIFENGDKEEYYVNYEDAENALIGSPNKFQKTYISSLNNCYVVISKNEDDFEKFVDIEAANDKDNIDHIKHMCDIGIPEEKEHKFLKSNLPEEFKYVYLISDTDCVLAVRVPSKENECKFIFKDRKMADIKKWQYPKQNIRKYLDETNENTEFSLKNLREKYS